MVRHLSCPSNVNLTVSLRLALLSCHSSLCKCRVQKPHDFSLSGMFFILCKCRVQTSDILLYSSINPGCSSSRCAIQTPKLFITVRHLSCPSFAVPPFANVESSVVPPFANVESRNHMTLLCANVESRNHLTFICQVCFSSLFDQSRIQFMTVHHSITETQLPFDQFLFTVPLVCSSPLSLT
jgi:hypothetical protein